MQKFIESRGIGLDQWFSTLFVRLQKIPRGTCGDLEEQYLHSGHTLKSLAPFWRAAGISEAEGLIWDSVSQGGGTTVKCLEIVFIRSAPC